MVPILFPCRSPGESKRSEGFVHIFNFIGKHLGPQLGFWLPFSRKRVEIKPRFISLTSLVGSVAPRYVKSVQMIPSKGCKLVSPCSVATSAHVICSSENQHFHFEVTSVEIEQSFMQLQLWLKLRIYHLTTAYRKLLLLLICSTNSSHWS